MRVFLALLMLLPAVGFAYPVFYQCDAEGRMTDNLTTPDIAKKITRMLTDLSQATPLQKETAIRDLCQGGELCVAELNQLLQMAETNGALTEEIIAAEIKMIRFKAGLEAKKMMEITPMPQNIFSNLQDYEKTIQSVALARECRVDKKLVTFDNFADMNGKCTLANFHHSPYMYPSGLRLSGTTNISGNRKSDKPDCTEIDALIISALVTDHDPYAVLAVSLMENGTSVGSLYLDDIGKIRSIGCEAQSATRGQHNVDSYGTYYNVKWGVVENPKLLSNIGEFAKVRKSELTPGTSYYCYTQGEDNHDIKLDENGGLKQTVYDSPQPKSCCLKVPYKKDSLVGMDLDSINVYSSFDKYFSSPLETNIASNDPAEKMARRLQRFNGYSDSMGGAEAVSAWRSGVNYYKTPAYGYQAMDFVVNTLWNNPYIESRVKEVETLLGRGSKSIACQDRAAGAYVMENDLFFKKHADSPRMTAIRARLAQKGSVAALPRRDQNVLVNEFMEICQAKRADEAQFCKPMAGSLNALDAVKKEMTDKIALLQVELAGAEAAAIVTAYNTFKNDLEKKGEAIMDKVRADFVSKGARTMMPEYWSRIYPKRNTIAKANRMDQGFTWSEMDEQQFHGLLMEVISPTPALYPQ